MAMTAAVKDELSRVDITKSCCRKAEVSKMSLRKRRAAEPVSRSASTTIARLIM